MLLIVEGIDRVGKSTMCKELSKQFGGIPVYEEIRFDNSIKDSDNETDKILSMLNILKHVGGDLIFDRLHLTDFAYGIEKRKYKREKAKNNLLKIDEFIQENFKSITVIVNPISIEKSSNEHGENLRIIQNNFLLALQELDPKCDRFYYCNYITIWETARKIREENKYSKGVIIYE